MQKDVRDYFDEGKSFFKLGGSAIMKLTPKAAIEVCEEATRRNLIIARIEGGHWLNPGFRPDMSTIWDSRDDDKVEYNNKRAIENIKEDSSNGYNAFIITIIGYNKSIKSEQNLT